MAFNFRSSGSKQVFLDDSQLSNHRYYRFPDETGTFVTSVSTGSFPFTASNAISSSYAITASNAISSSYAITASRAVTSSYAVSASHLIGGVSGIFVSETLNDDPPDLSGLAISSIYDNSTQALAYSYGMRFTDIQTGTGYLFPKTITIGGQYPDEDSTFTNNQDLYIRATTLIPDFSLIAAKVSLTGSYRGDFLGTRNNTTQASFVGLVSSASYVQIYDNTTGTTNWTKPSWAQRVTVFAIGGGGGGGAGHSGTAPGLNLRSGGSGGAGGEIVFHTYRASDLPSTVSIQVGGGGPGGSITNNTPTGSQGGFSRFGNSSDTSYAVLQAHGGYGGHPGVSVSTSSFLNTSANPPIYPNVAPPTPGRPATANSFGSGGGGMGTTSPGVNWKDTGSLSLASGSGMRFAPAPSLPYTVNDVFMQSFRYFSGSFAELPFVGIPASVTTTGGGGGTGATNAGTFVANSATENYRTGSAPGGGQILNENVNEGGRRGFTAAQNTFRSQGIIRSSHVSSTALEKFLAYVKIGVGGAGGYTNMAGTSVSAQPGVAYGGGGGGGRAGEAGQAGASGAVIVISEA